MDTTPTRIRPGDLVLTDDDRLALASTLAAAALPRSRTLCLSWIRSDDRATGVLVPVREVPEKPDVDDARRFGMVIASVTEQSAAGGSVVAVLCRPGDDTITDADRAWNAALREQAATHGFRLHGLFVGSGSAVRPLAMDDAGSLA
ncbi:MULTISPECIES: hypothetical protein [unclassified Isoptericola]|uniref:hypothetical protein n=1 Tax=unclassified Isoptericola TaxID=2623355 RepID=UPI002712ABD1|nr:MULTISPECIES: hypothetical protein [unclassified Isoptericola]MDO8144248.1 hypothetical protein [Isoptericola sp. 178]MDO8148102.1 hypothetical protein [Isoptericola sp. b515]MDO8151578.1 hypothetical protein [Isoptericola sp. b408]